MSATERALAELLSGHVESALSALKEEAWRNPAYASFVNLAAAERAAGLLPDAEYSLKRAINFDHRRHEAWHNLSGVFTDLGEFDLALEYSARALKLAIDAPGDISAPAQRQIALSYAVANMRLHHFERAWPAWETGRLNASWHPFPGTDIWRGQQGGCILVICEGGYGDAMLFGRWLPLVKERASRVKLMLWQRMIDWRDWSALGVDEVIAKEDGVDPAGIDYSISWMSLPGLFGMRSVADIPLDDGLCKPCENYFSDALCSPTRIGFCWRAEETSTIRRVRSLDPAAAQSIADHLNRYGEVRSLIPRGKALYREEDFAIPTGVVQYDSALEGWRATTAFIRSCRAVVTVDTAVAHLAGLCGVPTLLLLPCSSDWKWGTAANQPTDPWYGTHVRYFRNADPLKWDMLAIEEAISTTLTS